MDLLHVIIMSESKVTINAIPSKIRVPKEIINVIQDINSLT